MRSSDLRAFWIKIWARGRVSFGSNPHIEAGAKFDMSWGGTATIGERLSLKRGAIICPAGGRIVIGDNLSLNPYSILYGHGGLTIGNDVRIAAGTVIIPSNHNFESREKPITQQGLSRQGITIEDDVWIGANVTVLDGSYISKGCVIAAGAVVRGETEAYGIYGGVPAKLIKFRP